MANTSGRTRQALLGTVGLGTIGLVVLVFVAAGCSRRAQITGTVKLEGKLLTGGTVSFVFPDKTMRSGGIGPDGAYRVEDVPLGTAKVTVRTHARVPPGLSAPANLQIPNPPGAKEQPPMVAIPKRYGDPDRSKLTFDVRAGEQTYEIKLEP
jgi:hypothetical protein